MKDSEYGFEKYGWPDYAKELPAAYHKLKLVRVIKESTDRPVMLLRCPSCKTYFLYERDYEFLANGTEDEEYLTRLKDSDAREYLKKRKQR